jgi:hypothetical protein
VTKKRVPPMNRILWITASGWSVGKISQLTAGD